MFLLILYKNKIFLATLHETFLCSGACIYHRLSLQRSWLKSTVISTDEMCSRNWLIQVFQWPMTVYCINTNRRGVQIRECLHRHADFSALTELTRNEELKLLLEYRNFIFEMINVHYLPTTLIYVGWKIIFIKALSLG